MTATARASLSVVELPKEKYQEISNFHDEKYHAMWCYMHAFPRPCYTKNQLQELNASLNEVRTYNQNISDAEKIRYHIMASNIEGVFSLGGDLEHFKQLIVNEDRDELLDYAILCINAINMKMIRFDTDVFNISLVQGDALGGGFECALASDIIVAERNTKMGFPEIIFNLFPGMGAYSLLARKTTRRQAQEMILSGRLYSAEELYEIGVVDVLAEEYQGELAVYDYIKKTQRSANGHLALRKAADITNPVTYKELLAITKVWVDAALRLKTRDLRMMERLVSRQSRTKTSSEVPLLQK